MENKGHINTESIKSGRTKLILSIKNISGKCSKSGHLLQTGEHIYRRYHVIGETFWHTYWEVRKKNQQLQQSVLGQQ